MLIEPLLIPDTEAARLCGISRAHLHRLRASGCWGPTAVRLGRKVQYSRKEVVEWVQAACPPADVWAAMKASAARRMRVS